MMALPGLGAGGSLVGKFGNHGPSFFGPLRYGVEAKWLSVTHLLGSGQQAPSFDSTGRLLLLLLHLG